ncbi:MAG: hypothetical protein RMJ98_02315 [Myxococcales bacterium]|nr:hypothetical protein [Polyangiaceae bacterium]MDW8248123.1 hypothetical protein [Myxococcales bacterium]
MAPPLTPPTKRPVPAEVALWPARVVLEGLRPPGQEAPEVPDRPVKVAQMVQAAQAAQGQAEVEQAALVEPEGAAELEAVQQAPVARGNPGWGAQEER